ncbi:MAG TPA: aminotransferase class V-fold PLP-dependent enzyme [Candidatus Polarisedimenticolia bacterium]|jgi:cysteine desulfurase family protein|nr:aminotransferase class V-fold PLP-dependent enzyme [Candidatus Polarisedimenticolia bacterium]
MIYLDNAATSFPKPEPVYRGMEEFVRASGANPGRGGHRRAVEAEGMINDTRRLLARLLGVPRPERIVFGHNATDGLNMAIKGVVRPGDHAITSVLEHNSVSRPLNRLEQDGVIALTRVPATSDHLIDPDEIARAFRPNTRLVALTQASNVTGTIQPIAAIGRIARQHGALLLVDAAQSAGVVPIDCERDGIDLLAFTGHKGLLGPTGTGGLVVGERAEVRTWREGGTGGDSTRPVQPEEFPHRLEGGTPNVFGIAGLREGVRLLLERGVETVLAHERGLIRVFLEALQRPGKLAWYGADRVLADRNGDGRVGLVSVNLPAFAPAEVGAILDEQFDIAVRPGLHCAPYAHRHLGTFPQGTVRLSAGILTTADDMRRAAAAFDEISA